MSLRLLALLLPPLAMGCELAVVDYDAVRGPIDWSIEGTDPGDAAGGGALILREASDASEGIVFMGAPGYGPGGGLLALLSPPQHSTVLGFDDAQALVLGTGKDRLGSSATLLPTDEATLLVVGAPGAAEGSGEVWLLDPQSLQGRVDPEALVATRITGREDNEALGASAAQADLDGDGLADLLLGAPGGGDGDLEDRDEGRVYLFDGALLQQTPGAELSTDDSLSHLSGSDGSDSLGHGLQAGPDVDGDGLPDLLACSGQADSLTRNDVGACALVLGGEDVFERGDSWYSSFWSEADLVVYGDEDGDALGSGPSGGVLVDLDGDDRPELVAGIPGADTSEADGGRVAVFFLDELGGYVEAAEADLEVSGRGGFGSALAPGVGQGHVWVGAPELGEDRGAWFSPKWSESSEMGTSTPLLPGPDAGDALGAWPLHFGSLTPGEQSILVPAPSALDGRGRVNIRSTVVSP